jgi:hypothetical protein
VKICRANSATFDNFNERQPQAQRATNPGCALSGRGRRHCCGFGFLRAGRIPSCPSTPPAPRTPRLLEPRAASRQLCKGVSSLYCGYIKKPDNLRLSSLPHLVTQKMLRGRPLSAVTNTSAACSPPAPLPYCAMPATDQPATASGSALCWRANRPNLRGRTGQQNRPHRLGSDDAGGCLPAKGSFAAAGIDTVSRYSMRG